MTKNKARKRKTRVRAAALGISHTAAHYADPVGAGDPAVLERMRLTGASPETAARMVNDAQVNAARFAEDDFSLEARFARNNAALVEYWEQCRAGRLVRWWTVHVDIWTAALDEHDARHRLLGHQRSLYHYAAGVPTFDWRLDMAEPQPLTEANVDVLEVPAADLDAQRRAELIEDYPPSAWRLRNQPRSLFGVREQTHLDDYVGALHRASTRLIAGIDAQQEAELRKIRGVLPPDTPLRFFRAQRYTSVLAGPDEASARARGKQLAATVVDYLGRPVGQLATVKADDGFVSATDGHWVHPAERESRETVDGLWADYEAYQTSTDHARSQGDGLLRATTTVRAAWNTLHAEVTAYEARLHTQPDGTRTLCTPADLELIEQQTITEATAKRLTPAQLREAADADDYTADRVYGRAVENDTEIMQIERLHHRAAVLRRLANQITVQDQSLADTRRPAQLADPADTLPIDTTVVAVDPARTSASAYIGVVTHHSTRENVLEHVVEWRGGGTSFCVRDEIIPITGDDADLLRRGALWRDTHDGNDLLDVLAQPKRGWTGTDLIALARLVQQAESGMLWCYRLEGRYAPAHPLLERAHNLAVLTWMASNGRLPHRPVWTTELHADGDHGVLRFTPDSCIAVTPFADTQGEAVKVELAPVSPMPLLLGHATASQVLRELDRAGAVARWPHGSADLSIVVCSPQQPPLSAKEKGRASS